MTAAFDEFIRQHKMTGSQKADGYSTHVLERLMGREKDIAFKLLKQELPWSAHWIFLLDAERAVAVLKEQEQVLRSFFKRVILFELNPNAVARASRHLLDSLGFSCATELSKKDYDQLTSHLRSEDDELKQKALKQIGVVA